MKASGVPARDALRAWHVALLYTALTAILAYPLVRHPAGHVLNVSPDTDLFLWTLSWDAHALTRQPLSVFDANIFAPLHGTLAYSEHMLGSGMLAAPILGLTHNPVLAMNLVALLSCVLCGLGTFLLARRAGAAPAGAVLAGVIFAFAPPRFLRLDQLFLTTIQWVPFSLAYLHAYLDGGEKRHLRLAAAFFTLQALTSGHGTVFLALTAALLCGYRASLGEPLAIRKRVRDLGVAGALLLAPIVPMVVAYARVQTEMGLKRTLADWVVTRPASFLASPAYVHAYLLERFFPGAQINGAANAYLFPGYIPLLLAAAALAAARSSPSSRQSSTGVYTLLVLSCVWLAVGPPFGIWPLVYWLPGLNFIRVASRFMLPAMLGLSVLAGLGFDRLTRRLGGSARLGVTAAAGVLLVAEFLVPFTTTPYAVVTPPADRWLARQTVPFTVAEVPLPPLSRVYEFEKRQAEFMLHSTEHWQKTVHGWSGLQPPAHLALYDRLTRFPDDDSLRALAEFHVDYLVVHTDLYPPGEWAAVETRLAAYQGRMELRHDDGAGRVYALTTPHARLDTSRR
jgi:hypothetical protein